MARHGKASDGVAAQRFGAWLRGHRESRELPLRVVAAAAEMDQAHLSKVELGQRLLTAGQAAAIAKFFQIDPQEVEARRIAEKFRLQHANNPAALQAIQLLSRNPVLLGARK